MRLGAQLVAATIGVTVCLSAAGRATEAPEAPRRLKYVVIVSRHGVRSPLWTPERLNQYSAEPWPEWDVPVGDLTPHGRTLMRLMGAYYGEWFSGEGLLGASDCRDASRIYVWADRDERTLESGRALADALQPGCGTPVHSQSGDGPDPLFNPLGAGLAPLDPERAADAVRQRIGSSPRVLLEAHLDAFVALARVLTGDRQATTTVNDGTEVSVSATGKAIDLTGPLATGSTLAENLLLEYTNGFQGRDLGWGRLDRETLVKVLELHVAYTDLVRKTKYVARTRGSNLVAHILRSIQQAIAGKALAGALGRPGDAVLILSGHDTNLSNISGMLDLSWRLPGYQPDDTPPGGALVFSLWQKAGAKDYVVRAQYVAQSLDQMRDARPITRAMPPEQQDLLIPGCPTDALTQGCAWPIVERALQRAIDPKATSISAVMQTPIAK